MKGSVSIVPTTVGTDIVWGGCGCGCGTWVRLCGAGAVRGYACAVRVRYLGTLVRCGRGTWVRFCGAGAVHGYGSAVRVRCMGTVHGCSCAVQVRSVGMSGYLLLLRMQFAVRGTCCWWGLVV